MGAAGPRSVASLAANVAVAEPTLIGRVVAGWPSFALTASYELLTRDVSNIGSLGHHCPRSMSLSTFQRQRAT